FRPFSVTGGHPRVPARTADDDRGRELLRQLRDLDDDLAAGKLTHGDHARLRDPVEREAAAVLGRGARRAARSTAVVTPARRASPAPPQRRGSGAGQGRWRRRTVPLLALAAAAASLAILLAGAVSARHAGQTITGNPVPGAVPVAGSPGGSAPAPQAGRKRPTPQQLAAVAAAEAQVKQNPKAVRAHLKLAGDDGAAGGRQLAAVEYLAATRLDPANAEANTSLALLAFEVGRAARGRAMVDRVLAAHPDYPEALYVRGLINLMGLHRPKAAERDFSA